MGKTTWLTSHWMLRQSMGFLFLKFFVKWCGSQKFWSFNTGVLNSYFFLIRRFSCLQFFSSVTFPRFGSFPYLTSYLSTSIAMLMNLLSRYDISVGPNELFCLVNMTNSEKQISSFKCSATLNKKEINASWPHLIIYR